LDSSIVGKILDEREEATGRTHDILGGRSRVPSLPRCGAARRLSSVTVPTCKNHAISITKEHTIMNALFEYKQHPRAKERVTTGPPTVKAAAKSLHPQDRLVNRFNRKVGLGITTTVGTMWCAYAFILIACVSLPAAIFSHDPIIIIAWIAQTFLQLVLLPVIIVGQNIQAAAADARSAATYEDAGAILEEAKQIQLHLASQDAAIGALLDKIKSLEEVKAAE